MATPTAQLSVPELTLLAQHLVQLSQAAAPAQKKRKSNKKRPAHKHHKDDNGSSSGSSSSDEDDSEDAIKRVRLKCKYGHLHHQLLTETGSKPPAIEAYGTAITSTADWPVTKLCICGTTPETTELFPGVAHSKCIDTMVDRLSASKSYTPIAITCKHCQKTYTRQIPRISSIKKRHALYVIWLILSMFLLPCYVLKAFNFHPERKQLLDDRLGACARAYIDRVCPAANVTVITAEVNAVYFWTPGFVHCSMSLVIWFTLWVLWRILHWILIKLHVLQ